MVKDGYEDHKRHKSDRNENNGPTKKIIKNAKSLNLGKAQ